MKITIVIPVCNELNNLEPLVEGILEHAAQYNPRILFIDDGSTDGSSTMLDRLHERFVAVDVIRFRRNRGKSAALAAGFAHADGDVIVTMDADLQDDPKEIPRFIEKINEGYDMVVGWKQVRHDPWSKTFPSRIYNGAAERLFNLGLHDINCGFKAVRAEAAKKLLLIGDMHRLMPVLAAEKGCKIAEIPVEHHPRRYGQSKYGCERFLRGAADMITLYFLTRHREAPNHFFGGWGLAAGVLGVLVFLYALPAWSWRSLLVSLVLMLGGGILIGLGLLGELAIRLYAEKNPMQHEMEIFFH
jgi:glycosyltransferase involved in cell wall biosynthesis